MLRIIRIRRAGRPPRRPRTFKQKVFILFWIVLLAFTGGCVLLFLQLLPLVTRVALSVASNMVTQQIDESVITQVSDGAVVYGNLIKFEKDDSGKITALTNNMAELSRVRAKLANQLIADLSSLTVKEFGIPVGNLTGSPLFSGRGPKIPLKILSVGTVHTEFENTFVSSGINQTLHTIFFKVSVDIQVLIPGNIAETTVENKVNIAETVIVGTVPDNYTYFSQFDTAKDAADAHFDYSAQNNLPNGETATKSSQSSGPAGDTGGSTGNASNKNPSATIEGGQSRASGS